MCARILLVDDEPGVRFGLSRSLRDEGYEVVEAENVAGALLAAQTQNMDLALLDYELPDGNALELMEKLWARKADVPVVILTAHAAVDLAVRAMKEGAAHFLPKPVDTPTLVAVLTRTLADARNKKLVATRARTDREWDPFVGGGAAADRLRELAERAASAAVPVLIQGETGSGKGVLAKWIHRQGPRRDEAFVDLNCAGLNRDFLISELFGHERGAFTGAVQPKQGLFEFADRGTLFLDEIGDMDIEVQAMLLKAVEEKSFRRMGATKPRTSDFRIIAASHLDLGRAMQERKFREDLYYRLGTVVLRIPPLRERPEEIPGLVGALFPGIAAELARPRCHLSPSAMRSLSTHTWPGNVRELRNVLERAVLMARGDLLEPDDLEIRTPAARPMIRDGDLRLEAVEKAHVLYVWEKAGRNADKAARDLGISRSAFYQKLKIWKASGGTES